MFDYHVIDLDQPPSTVTVYLNEYAQYYCYVREGMPRLFWFVNSLPVQGLPERYSVSSTSEPTADGIGSNSSLQILALEETNNSEILCGVDLTGRIDIHYFPTAFLLVQGTINAVTIQCTD